MNNTRIIILAIIPIAIFFSSFLVARQFRALENVPMFFKMFVQHRLLLSFVTGFFMSLMFTIIFALGTSFTPQLFLGFIGFSLLTTFCYYIGVTFGWGNSISKKDEESTTLNQVQIDSAFPENIMVENSLNFVKITINTKKRWLSFSLAVFNWIMMSLVFLLIPIIAIISLMKNNLLEIPALLAWFLFICLILYFLYRKFRETLEYIFDKEIIEIDNLSLRIEKYGWKFSNKEEYSADSIKMITAMFLFGKTSIMIKRSRFVNSNMPAFIIWQNRGLNRHHTFGRALDLADAQRILEMIYAKFPQYKS